MLPHDEPPVAGAPDWLLTYGDLMSLLLTFFVMLVSMSELKSEPRVVQAVEAMNEQFGKERRDEPGLHRPRGAKMEAPLGTAARIEGVRTGRHAMIGGSVMFDEDTAELRDDQVEKLQFVCQQFLGKAQKIEIRGHTTRRPLPDDSPYRDHWDLAYARCRKAFEIAVAAGVEPGRIRLSVAGANEPSVVVGDDPLRRRENARVEAFLLNEFAEDYENAAAAAAARP